MGIEEMSNNKNKSEPKVDTGNDLDQLRNILYGNQARATEQRLDELEVRLENISRELQNNLQEQVASLSGSTDQHLKAVEEKLTQTNTNINQRLDQQIGDLRKQLADFRAESRQRDADLRQEMLTLGAMLDKQKTGRYELGQLMVELGQQLQQNAENTAVSDN
jgi:tetrahydromethanopterin S-methyltransferase subunit G